MTFLDLMPEPTVAQRCADFAQGLAIDPVGSAIRADLLIAVEIPLPWPKPVFDHPALAGVAPAVAAAPQPTRVLAAVPNQLDHAAVIAYWRTDEGPPVRAEWRVPVEDVAELAIAVVGGHEPVHEVEVDEAPSRPELWICTQGSHDRCCGSDGTRLAQLIAQRNAGEVVVRRVSHTGGHRFAPTALSMPDGRMWAYLDVDDVDRLLDRSAAPPPALVAKCRGWWGAETGAAQVAERAGFAAHGWAWDDYRRAVSIVDATGDAGGPDVAVEIQAAGPDGGRVAYRSSVRIGREVPTIACGAVGGLPAKPGKEWALTSFEPIPPS